MGWRTSGVIMSIEDCLWLWMCKIGSAPKSVVQHISKWHSVYFLLRFL